MFNKNVTTKKMPWFSDIAEHPRSELIPFYTSGRCHNPDSIVCPYCGYSDPDTSGIDVHYDSYPVPIESGPDVYCASCDKGFNIHASFGYGHSTFPIKCENGMHEMVFTAQYHYMSETSVAHNARIFNCLCCDYQKYHRSERPFLPWRDEYDDPDYFDPEGKLKSDLAHPIRPTPILDAITTMENDWGSSIRHVLQAALLKHEQEWNDECQE